MCSTFTFNNKITYNSDDEFSNINKFDEGTDVIATDNSATYFNSRRTF